MNSPPGESRSGDPLPPLQALDLLRTLAEHGVEFVVIGGFAVAAHGYVRATKDVDIFPAPSAENHERLAAALRALEAQVMGIEDFSSEELGIEPDEEGLALGGNWALRTRFGRLDVMQDVSGIKGYDHLRAGAMERTVPGLLEPVQFAGLEDIVAMKRAAGRDLDLIDIAELERARGAGS